VGEGKNSRRPSPVISGGEGEEDKEGDLLRKGVVLNGDNLASRECW